MSTTVVQPDVVSGKGFPGKTFGLVVVGVAIAAAIGFTIANTGTEESTATGTQTATLSSSQQQSLLEATKGVELGTSAAVAERQAFVERLQGINEIPVVSEAAAIEQALAERYEMNLTEVIGEYMAQVQAERLATATHLQSLNADEAWVVEKARQDRAAGWAGVQEYYSSGSGESTGGHPLGSDPVEPHQPNKGGPQ